jgi:translation initiation factor 2 beta subunit (eIF-2beta)/eIF-5
MNKNNSLDNVKEKIESMNKENQIEILKLLKKNAIVKLNENKSGTFVNLSYLPDEVVEDIQKYIEYINVQENNLQSTESKKQTIQNSFFDQDA